MITRRPPSTLLPYTTLFRSHQEAERVDRIARIGHQHHVAWRGDRMRHIGKTLFRAERSDDLGLGVELDAEAALVITGLRAAQSRSEEHTSELQSPDHLVCRL